MAEAAEPPPPTGASRGGDLDWRRNLVLFLLTVFSVFLAGSEMVAETPDGHWNLLSGWPFALPLMVILLFHEFGHWIAARIHGVPASLPYFIPLPKLGLFGTMGAVIMMPERIRSRNALLDIGAAGPIAGMVVAVPVLFVGLTLSEVQPSSPSGYLQEGQSLLYWALKRLSVGPIPEGHDVFLHPTALAGWAGFFITMINLLPWGQLDGGHIAYALLGERHHKLGSVVRWALLVLFAYNLYLFVWPVMNGTSNATLEEALGNSLFWLIWFGVTYVMGRFFGGFQHPHCEPGALTRPRRAVAWGCLLLFLLLFMPTPMSLH